MYQANSDNTSGVAREQKQSPKPLPASAFGRATTPASKVVQVRPNYVVVNGQSATAYQFLYETTASLGGIDADGVAWESGLDLQAISNSPIKLDIQPLAWKGGGDATGEVTFVYRGGL
jgi:hypothetical protein